MTRLLSGLVVAALLLPATALAQVEEAPKKPEVVKREVYKAHEHHDFDETRIEASAKKPAGIWISLRDEGKFEKLIPERENFKADIAESLYRLDR